ncbi:MAG: ATP-binding cassette domain-containing protein [Eubacterium sp.]|nr:ATP-binding cassette domain-containing protein [Eubacterium sp.]
MAVIELEQVNKTYSGKNGAVQALKEVSLSVEEGEIFGVIGLSGAGKSTLVRCINLLERPESGWIRVGGKDISALSKHELRLERQNIAMIFQQFNLLMQRTVLDNVCFPLEIAGLRKKEARKEALEYLRIVGLEDKARAYPVQLSGGQQQRVAIARALASHPHIILCDEATSALDPQTTRTILELLRKVNREYNISIVIITHEMRVITEICDRVAVLYHGTVAETGPVQEVFRNPRSRAARQLLLLRESEQLEEELAKEEPETADETAKTEAAQEPEQESKNLRVIKGGAHAVG